MTDGRDFASLELPGMARRFDDPPQNKTSVRLARELARYISDNKLAEGTKLPVESEMVNSFKVGRPTLREALRLLEMRGIITIKSGRGGGPEVRRPRTTDLTEALTLILQFRSATLADVIEARLVIEPAICRRAAETITPERLAELRDTVDQMLRDPSDEVNFAAQNERFHSLVADSAGSAIINVFIDSLKAVHDGRLFGVHYSPRRVTQVAQAHLKIIEGLEVGDSSESEELMRRHLDEAKRYWARRFPESYARPIRWMVSE